MSLRLLSIGFSTFVFIFMVSGQALAQRDYCSTIYDLREAKEKEYEAEKAKPGSIDKNKNLAAINEKYEGTTQEAWNTLIRIESAKGEITDLSATSDGAFVTNLSVKLSCSSKRHVWNHNLRNKVSYKEGTPVYEALRKMQVGSIIYVTGRHVRGTTYITAETPLENFSLKAVDGNLFVFEGLGQTVAECSQVAQAQRIADQEMAAAQRKKDQKNPIVQGAKAKKGLEEKVVRPIIEKIDDALYKK